MKVKIKRILFLLALGLTLLISETKTTYAAAFSSGKDGTYSLNGSLSCYVPAMGGVEFGAPLVKGIQVKISGGEATMTVSFRKSQVTIYSVTCDTFLSATEGKTGYYDKNGSFHSAQTTLSSDTAKNSANEDVKYITSMTFPLDQKTKTYKLGVYVDSNVMGTQFGAGGSYDAVLTVDWSNVPEKETQASTTRKEETTTSTKEEKNTTSTKADSAATAENKKKEEQKEEISAVTTAQQEENSTEATSTGQDNTAEAEVVEKDGLNIHYAGGEQKEVKETETKEGKTGLIAGTAVILLIGAGAVFVFWRRRTK